MELLPGAAERGQPSHVPAQGVQGACVGACGVQRTHTHCPGHTQSLPRAHIPQLGLQQSSRHLEMPPSLTLTCLHRGFHHTPGGIFPLACDDILLEGFQPVLHQGVERRAEGVQQQVAHVGVEPAVPQLGLREGKGST